MNTFTLLTMLGALGVLVSFFSGVRQMATIGSDTGARSRGLVLWRMIFDLTVFITILAAPLAR